MKNLLSDTHQLTRIVILMGIVLVVSVFSFGGFYYFDRFYTPDKQPEVGTINIAAAEQAVRDFPDDVEKRLVLAETYLFNERFNDAIIQANQVLAIEPETDRAWLVVGVSSARLGKPADAILPLSTFINARKDSEMPGLDTSLRAAAYYLGDSYLQMGMPENAIEPLTMAVDWSQTDADSMYKLGVAYSSIKDYAKAINMFHGATTFVPNFKEAYEAMAVAYRASGKPAHADYALGMSAYSSKEYAAALEFLTQSVTAEPNFVHSQAGLGLTYEAMGSLKEALAAFEAAVLLDPNNFTARNGVQRVTTLLNK